MSADDLASTKRLPRISVLMPVRNEERYIEGSLGSVLAQDYPEELVEVVVADGRSTDRTRELVNSLGAGRDVRLVDNPRRIAPTALNAAIAEARGEVLVRVDGHCEIAPDYLRRCVEHLQESGAAGVGGPIETVGESFLAQAIAAAMSTPFGVGGSAFRTGRDATTWVDTVAFPAYPRETVEAAGPFDEELVRNQDDEYNYRIRKAGGRLLLAPDVRSRYFSRATPARLWRQYFQYGYWKVRVLQKHPRQMSARQFAPPLFVLALLVTTLVALVGPGLVGRLGAWGFAAVAGSYLLANLGASAVTAARTAWGFLPVLPLLYSILHLSYGSGFLLGLIRFAGRWGKETR